MASSVHDGDLIITGTLRVNGGMLPGVARTALVQDDLLALPVNLADFRVWDAFGTTLPATSATDDLGLYTGTWGTNNPYIATSDLKNAGATTRYGRVLVRIPECYVAGQSITLRAAAGMITTVASTTATIDFEAYLVGRTYLVSGSELVSTAATSINSTTFGNKDFVLSTSTLTPGALLDIRVAIAVNDTATATAVIGALAALDLLFDAQG